MCGGDGWDEVRVRFEFVFGRQFIKTCKIKVLGVFSVVEIVAEGIFVF